MSAQSTVLPSLAHKENRENTRIRLVRSGFSCLYCYNSFLQFLPPFFFFWRFLINCSINRNKHKNHWNSHAVLHLKSNTFPDLINWKHHPRTKLISDEWEIKHCCYQWKTMRHKLAAAQKVTVRSNQSRTQLQVLQSYWSKVHQPYQQSRLVTLVNRKTVLTHEGYFFSEAV